MGRYYYDIKDQTNWPNTIVLVQIAAADDGEEPTALVRSSAGIHPDGYMPVSIAFAEAENARRNLLLDAVGVHLEDGAKWHDHWGQLVDQKGLGLP